MAFGDSFINCDTNGMSLETLLKSLAVTNNASGIKGFRCVIINDSDCDHYDDEGCATQGKTSEQIFRERIVLDDCGKLAIALFNTVD